jgi:cellulose synthase operon protein C
MSVCEKLQVFADGELPADEVPDFERHFAACAGCQSELEDVMVLEALAQNLRRPVELPLLETVPPLPSRRSSRRSTLALAGLAGVSAVAAGALLARFLLGSRRAPAMPAP